MTVALLGVGADSTNCTPTPPVGPDGRFEYVPIPEAAGPEGTVETATYGSTACRHRDGTLAALLDAIEPGWGDGRRLTGQALADWPLHHDPNLRALTYGETTSRGSYTRLLTDLEPGDAVAFYTGLRAADARYRHRYLIGSFTVASVLDCRALDRAGDTVPVAFSDLPRAEQTDLVEEHSANAHAKRYLATGALAAADDGLVIVDGEAPGGLLDRAVRISEHGGGGHHYLTDEYEAAFDPAPGGSPERNAYLGGIKPAHRLGLSAAAFRELVS